MVWHYNCYLDHIPAIHVLSYGACLRRSEAQTLVPGAIQFSHLLSWKHTTPGRYAFAIQWISEYTNEEQK